MRWLDSDNRPLGPLPGPSTVMARILFFGRVADALGREVQIALPAGGCSLAELRRRLANGDPHAEAALGRSDVRASVDQVIAVEGDWVLPEQEIAFFSMFSGG